MSHSIMYVDDDEDDLLFFSEAFAELHPEGRLIKAVHGLDAIEKLKKNYPDLPESIFLDLNMPVMNGYQFLAELKKHRELSSIPVFVLTTTSNPLEQEKVQQLGARGFYSKPSSVDGLTKIIEHSIENI